MEDKIMAGGNLDDILTRMSCCHTVMTALCRAMGEDDINSTYTDSFFACADLLSSICRDFEADISSAEDFQSEAGTA